MNEQIKQIAERLRGLRDVLELTAEDIARDDLAAADVEVGLTDLARGMVFHRVGAALDRFAAAGLQIKALLLLQFVIFRESGVEFCGYGYFLTLGVWLDYKPLLVEKLHTLRIAFKGEQLIRFRFVSCGKHEQCKSAQNYQRRRQKYPLGAPFPFCSSC